MAIFPQEFGRRTEAVEVVSVHRQQEVDTYLRATDLIHYVVPGSMHWRPNGYTLQLYANALDFLRKSSLFKETGWLFGLYHLGNVGWPLTDFRSFAHDNLAKSLQVTVGLRAGLVWVDVDHYNPGQSFTGFLGHLFIDFFWNALFRRAQWLGCQTAYVSVRGMENRPLQINGFKRARR